MTAAALGTTLTLPTLEGDLVEDGTESEVETSFTLEVKPGTQSGTEQVLRARGVPGLRNPGRGELIVTTGVETPGCPADRQEGLVSELAAIRGDQTPHGRVHPPAGNKLE